MKVNLFSANTTEASLNAVIGELKRNYQNNKHIVIVPDKFSLSVERDIFEKLDIQSSMTIDVVSFSRLAIKVLGAKAKKSLTKQGDILVFKKAIKSEKSNLKHYGKVALLPGFPKQMYAVISAMRNNGFSPDYLESKLESLSGGTKTKLQDIILLYRSYLKELSRFTFDSTSRLEALIDATITSDYIKSSYIYIVGFPTFTGKQYEIITELIKYSLGVNVAITPSNGGRNDGYYPCETKQRIFDICDQIEAPLEVIESFVAVKPPFDTLNRGLFTKIDKPVKSNGRLVLYKEKTVYEEINAVASEIAFLVRQKGLRYKDIAIINCNSAYNVLCASIFDRYDIPYFVDKRYPLRRTLLADFLIKGLDVLDFNFRQDKVILFVKHPLFGLSDSLADGFENYLLERGINFNGFLSDFKDAEYDKIRVEMIEKLSVFMGIGNKAEDFAKAGQQFVFNDKVKEALDNTLSNAIDATKVTLNTQCIEELRRVFSDIINLGGEEEGNFREHKLTLLSAIEMVEVVLIPQFVDSVFIGGLNDSRYSDIKVLFIISATSDVFPSVHSFQSIISARDSVLLEDNAIRMYPTPFDKMREDVFALLDLFTKVDKLYLGYHQTDPEGIEMRSSSVFNEINAICPDAYIHAMSVCRSLNIEYSENNLIEAVVTQRNAFFRYLISLRKDIKIEKTERNNLASIYASFDEEYKKRVNALLYDEKKVVPVDGLGYFREKDDYYLTKVTELESYFACPYKHFLQFGLKLKPRKEGQLQKNDIGTIIHAVLEYFFKNTMGKLNNMTENEANTVADRVIAEVFSDTKLVGESNDAYALNAIRQTRTECKKLLIDLFNKGKHTHFIPYYIEYTIDDTEKSEIKSAGKTFRFRGKIDRADIYKTDMDTKIIVIDYKTGSAIHSSLKDLYFGKALQLWFYMGVLQKEGNTPVGSFYLQISEPKNPDRKLSGYYDKEMMQYLDPEFDSFIKEAEITKHYEPNNLIGKIYKKKDGGISSRSKGFSDEKTIKGYIKYVTDVMQLALEEISEGYVAKSPIGEDGCTYCQFASICEGKPKICRTDKYIRKEYGEEGSSND